MEILWGNSPSKLLLPGVFSYRADWGRFSFMQVLNRPRLAQVFVYSLAGPRDQRDKHCVAMVSSSALPASDTKDSCSLLAFSITPIVSGRAEDKQKRSLYNRGTGLCVIIYSKYCPYGCHRWSVLLQKKQMCEKNIWAIQFFFFIRCHLSCSLKLNVTIIPQMPQLG